MNACGQALLGIGRLVHPPSGTAGNGQGRASARSFQPLRFPAVLLLFPECGHTSGHGVHKGEGRGLSYTPCLLMKPVLRLWLHATQSQPCFPAASNAIALSCGNGIFTATPAERITHYTLLRKVVCQKGRCPLWIPPNKQALCPCRKHSAVCCQQPVSRSACSSL